MRFLLCLLGCLAACSRDDRSTLDIVLERGELVVGTEPEFPPFESKNAQGEFVGFDMDMVRELAKDLGVGLRIEGMEFDALPPALDTRRIDLIVSGMTATPERAESRSFTDPYFRTGLCLLVGADSGITRAEEVDGRKVVVKLGTTGAKNAPKFFPNSPITRLPTEGACAQEVVTGRAAAFFYDQLSIQRHHQANKKTTRALLKPLTVEPYAMAVRLGDRKFVDRLNRFLSEMRKDGRFEKLREKYLRDLPDGSR